MRQARRESAGWGGAAGRRGARRTRCHGSDSRADRGAKSGGRPIRARGKEQGAAVGQRRGKARERPCRAARRRAARSCACKERRNASGRMCGQTRSVRLLQHAPAPQAASTWACSSPPARCGHGSAAERQPLQDAGRRGKRGRQQRATRRRQRWRQAVVCNARIAARPQAPAGRKHRQRADSGRPSAAATPGRRGGAERRGLGSGAAVPPKAKRA